MVSLERKTTNSLTWLIAHELPADKFITLCGQNQVANDLVALDYALQVSQHGETIYVVSKDIVDYINPIFSWSKQFDKPTSRLRFIKNTKLTTEALVSEFIENIKLFSPLLVVIDSAFAGSSSQESMDWLLIICAKIRNLGIAVLIVDHNEADSFFMLQSLANTVIEISVNDSIISIECKKMDNGNKFPLKQLQYKTAF